MESDRVQLIKAAAKLDKDVVRLRGIIDGNKKRIEELKVKIDQVSELQKLVKEVEKEQPVLNRSVEELNRLVMRVESLAEGENSRNSSNEQMRSINTEIGKAHEDLSRIEQELRQLESDRKDIEADIDVAKFEYDNRAGGAVIRLEQAYKTIQETRQDISQTRRSGLTVLLEREEKLAKLEADYQRLQTNVLLYRQLSESIRLELAVLNDESRKPKLQAEIDKADQAIQAIPTHPPLSTEARQADEAACVAILGQIQTANEEARATVARMAEAEKEGDSLLQETRAHADAITKLRRNTADCQQRLEALVAEVGQLHAREKTSFQDEQARVLDEIRQHKADKHKAKERIREKMAAKNAPFTVPVEMDKLHQRMLSDLERIDDRLKKFVEERRELEQGNEKRRNQVQTNLMT